jgi:hypothetical protein
MKIERTVKLVIGTDADDEESKTYLEGDGLLLDVMSVFNENFDDVLLSIDGKTYGQLVESVKAL